jgi:hypothetical protein
MVCFADEQERQKMYSNISPSADMAIQLPSTSSPAQQCPAEQKRQVTPGI